MTVREVLILAAENLGRDDLAAAISGEVISDAADKEIACLLRCYNLVENEIALDYCPLRAEETFEISGGAVNFTAFRHAPVHVQKAVYAGKLARFRTDAVRLRLPDTYSGKVTVSYFYAPTAKKLSDTGEFDIRISARLVSYGIAGEYCLLSGETSRAALWQRRFQDALRAAGLLRKTLSVRARRWV